MLMRTPAVVEGPFHSSFRLFEAMPRRDYLSLFDSCTRAQVSELGLVSFFKLFLQLPFKFWDQVGACCLRISSVTNAFLFLCGTNNTAYSGCMHHW